MESKKNALPFIVRGATQMTLRGSTASRRLLAGGRTLGFGMAAEGLGDTSVLSCSEHRVVVRRSGRHDLEDVPVFDDSSGIIETKDIDAGVVLVSWPLLKAMQDDEVSLRDGPFKLYPFAWVSVMLESYLSSALDYHSPMQYEIIHPTPMRASA